MDVKRTVQTSGCVNAMDKSIRSSASRAPERIRPGDATKSTPQKSVARLESENEQLRRDKRALMDEVTEIRQQAHCEMVRSESRLQARIVSLEASASAAASSLELLRAQGSSDARTIETLEARRLSLESESTQVQL